MLNLLLYKFIKDGNYDITITFATDDRQCLIINAPKYSFKSITTNDVVKIIDKAIK